MKDDYSNIKTPKKFSACSSKNTQYISPTVPSQFTFNNIYNTSTPKCRNEDMDSKSENNFNVKDWHFHRKRLNEKKYVLSDYIVQNSSKSTRKRRESNSLQNSVVLEAKDKDLCSSAAFDITDKDAFPSMDVNVSKGNQRKRRIKPTLMLSHENDQFGSSNNRSFECNAFLNASEVSEKSLAEERNLLKEKRDKLKDSSETLLNTKVTLSSSNLIPFTNSNSESPSLSQVTHVDKLNILIEMYVSFVLCNMVPNIIVEFYFLLQLLTLNINEILLTDIRKDREMILDSIHNSIYFSVKSLSRLFSYLILIDKHLGLLLLGNSRIKTFDLNFHEFLVSYVESNSNLKIDASTYLKAPILSVSFQADTDNRDNFPSTSAFQLFKKQRDLFYEVNESLPTNFDIVYS